MGNTIFSNYNDGISPSSSNNTTISNNTISSNTNHGIYLRSSSNTTITGNNIALNNDDGIGFSSSSNTTITGNTITLNNDDGIFVFSSSNTTITDNTISNSTKYGINATYNNEYTINATYNYWGSNSGPYHETKNPNGTGDNVTDHVIFNPWLKNESGKERGRFYIRVRDSKSYAALPNTTITIIGDGMNYTLTTNESGSAEQEVAGDTSYTLIAEKEGYNSQKRYVYVEEGEEEWVYFYLRKEPGRTWYVDDDAPEGGNGSREKPFNKVQNGVDAADDDDTVRVWEGTYYENVVVNKSVSLVGNGSEETTIDANGTRNGVMIEANWVNLSGFMMTGARESGGENESKWTGVGIYVTSSNNSIFWNNCSNNTVGIALLNSTSNNTVQGNIAGSNLKTGINTVHSDTNRLTSNMIWDNGINGIYFSKSTDNIIEDNSICYNGNTSGNYRAGIWIYRADDNMYINNTVSNNNRSGLLIKHSENSTIMNNTCSSNVATGINLQGCAGGSISKNTVSGNPVGVYLHHSENVLFMDNTCYDNQKGLFLYGASNNEVFRNNFRNNGQGIYVTGVSSYSMYNEAHYNSIVNNTEWGINATNNDGNTINATNNWWGNESGPYHETKNSNGTGDNVTDYVIFDPWLKNETKKEQGRLYIRVRDSKNHAALPNTTITIKGDDVNYTLTTNETGNAEREVVGDKSYTLTAEKDRYHSQKRYIYVEEGEKEWVYFYLRKEPGRTWYVDDDAPEGGNGSREQPFNKIQDGVDAADDDDTVRVWDGHYMENVVVNKSLGLVGNGSKTVINGSGDGNVVEVVADGVNMSDFSVIMSGSGGWDAGILVESDDCRLLNNTLLWNRYGIYVKNSTGSQVKNNTCSGNARSGIYVRYSNHTEVSNNSCQDNGGGITIWDSDANTIVRNTCHSNDNNGIELQEADNNSVSNNNCSDNEFGLYLIANSHHNSITNNELSRNENGAGLRLSDHNYLARNNCSFNEEYGIYLNSYADDNRAYFNIIAGNGEYGIHAQDNKEIINATYNWWGNESGPYHEEKNPNGTGDNVTDYVIFDPWLESEDEKEPALLYGYVRDEENGTVLANVTITIEGLRINYTTVTNESGYYERNVEGEANYSVVAEREDYEPQKRHVYVAESDDVRLDFALEKRKTELYGGVYEKGTNRTISDVRVTITSTGCNCSYTTYTDSKGHYERKLDHGGNYTVKAERRWYEPQTTNVTIQNNSEKQLDFYLEREERNWTIIEGYVRDNDTGKGIHAVDILIYTPGHDDGISTTSDEDGRYFMERHYFLENLTIEAEKQGYRDFEDQIQVKEGARNCYNFTMRREDGNRTVIQGYVTEEEERYAIEQATMTIRGPEGNYTTQTNKDGYYEQEVEGGGDYTVLAGKVGYRFDYELVETYVERGEKVRWNLSLKKERTVIHGYVYQKGEETPLENARVTITGMDCNCSYLTLTNRTGHYEQELIHGGNFTIRAEKSGYISEVEEEYLGEDEIIVIDFYLNKKSSWNDNLSYTFRDTGDDEIVEIGVDCIEYEFEGRKKYESRATIQVKNVGENCVNFTLFGFEEEDLSPYPNGEETKIDVTFTPRVNSELDAGRSLTISVYIELSDDLVSYDEPYSLMLWFRNDDVPRTHVMYVNMTILPVYELELKDAVGETEFEMRAGTDLDLTQTLRNLGNAVDYVFMETAVEGQGIAATVREPLGAAFEDLEPVLLDEEASGFCSVRLETGIGMVPGEYHVTVTARSENDHTVNSSVNYTITVTQGEKGGVELSADFTTLIIPGHSNITTVPITITNTGKYHDTYILSVRGLDPGWSVDLGGVGSVSLDPDGTGDFILTLTKENASANATMGFEVHARSTTDPTVFDSLTLEVVEKGTGDDDDWEPLPGFDSPALVVGISVGALVCLFVLVGSEAGRYRLLLLLFLPLYTRLGKKEVLDDFNRGRIMGYIEANPGVYYTDIMTTLDLNNGTLAYHLNVLEKQGFIASRREGLYRLFYARRQGKEDTPLPVQRFFSTGTTRKNFRPSSIQQRIVDIIEEFQGISQAEIAEMLEMSKQSLGYHIRKLRRASIVTVKREKGNTRCFIREQPVESLR